MYDKYFTKEQRERLPFFTGQPNPISDEWRALVARFQALMAANTPQSEPEPQQLACRWMSMLMRDTGGDVQLALKLNELNANEPAERERNGITTELSNYVQQAFAAYRLGLFESHLSPEEFAFMKANYGKRAAEMPSLIARIDQMMAEGRDPADPAVQQLARQWLDVFVSYAGTDPATHLKIRAAQAAEPGLRAGTFVSEDLVTYIRASMAAAQQKPA